MHFFKKKKPGLFENDLREMTRANHNVSMVNFKLISFNFPSLILMITCARASECLVAIHTLEKRKLTEAELATHACQRCCAGASEAIDHVSARTSVQTGTAGALVYVCIIKTNAGVKLQLVGFIKTFAI